MLVDSKWVWQAVVYGAVYSLAASMAGTPAGCARPVSEADPDDVRDAAEITVRVRVVSYDSDAVHSIATTPDGITYHPDMHDAAYCKVEDAAGIEGLPDPFVIWGWNRTEYVPERLRSPKSTAVITFSRSALDDTPIGTETRGVQAIDITSITD